MSSKKKPHVSTPRSCKRDEVSPTVQISVHDPLFAEWLARNWSDRCKVAFLLEMGNTTIEPESGRPGVKAQVVGL